MTAGVDKFAWHKAFMAAHLNVTCKAVGARIWDYTGPDGSNAHPGNENLSLDLGISTRTIIRTLQTLRDSGWLVRTSGSNSHPNRKWSDVYQLTYPDRVTNETDRVTNETDRVTPVTRPSDTPVTPTDPLSDPLSDPLHQVLDPVERDPLPPTHIDEAPQDLATRFREALGTLTGDEMTKIQELWDKNTSYYKILVAIRADRDAAKRRSRTA